MADIRYAIVNQAGDIINIVVASDQGTGWLPPENCDAIPSDEMDIGGTYIDGVYTPPPAPVSEYEPAPEE